jgi:hypothetical protein
MRGWVCNAALAAALGLRASTASAQEAAAPPSAKTVVASSVALSPDAVRRLKSTDAAQLKSALDEIRVSGARGAPAAPAIIALLRRGLPTELTIAALDTLGDTDAVTGSDVLAWYVHHRDPNVRRSAVGALAKARGDAATKALRAALSDSDPGVRGLAATGLGTMKATGAVPDLFRALDHGVLEAAAAIGQVCSNADCDRLAAKLGGMPFDVVANGLDEALLRPPSEVGDDFKVKIVGRVRAVATPEANRFLKSVQTRFRLRASPHVKQAIDSAVTATTGASGVDRGENAP